MLEKLLQILEEDGVQQPGDLAQRLGVSRELVEQMLIFLTKAGKVQQLAGTSLICTGRSCLSCAIASNCHLPAQPQVRNKPGD